MVCRPCNISPAALRITVLLLQIASSALSKRHVVYWNSTNPRLTQEDYTVQVDINDYLDIYCPHYPTGLPTPGPPEILTLYQVGMEQFQGCVETEGAVKRWECNRPHAPFGPVRFSEKIQKYSPFSVGLEFRPGHHYYYSSLSTEDGPTVPCLKLKVSVCCKSTTPTPHRVVHGPSAAAAAAVAAAVSTYVSLPLLLLLLVSAI